MTTDLSIPLTVVICCYCWCCYIKERKWLLKARKRVIKVRSWVVKLSKDRWTREKHWWNCRSEWWKRESLLIRKILTFVYVCSCLTHFLFYLRDQWCRRLRNVIISSKLGNAMERAHSAEGITNIQSLENEMQRPNCVVRWCNLILKWRSIRMGMGMGMGTCACVYACLCDFVSACVSKCTGADVYVCKWV